MSYLFVDMASWLVGKTVSDEDEVVRVTDEKSGDLKEQKNGEGVNEGEKKDERVEGGEVVEKEEGIDEEEAKDVGNSLEKDIEEVSQLAYHKAKDLGSYFINLGKSYSQQVVKSAQSLKEVIEEKTLIGEFSREQEKFVTTNKKKVASDMAVPPWVGYNEEDVMKIQILDLSKDKRNLLRDPPAGIHFNFDFEANFPVALTMLQHDPTLNSLRFQLVPKQIKEEVFWRNYFYRVSLIKQSTQLNSLTTPTDTLKNDAKIYTSQVDSSVEEKETKTEEEAEFVSDSLEQTDLLNDDLFTTAMQQLCTNEGDGHVSEEDLNADPINNEAGMAEWEAELQAELQEYEVVGDAALEQDILKQLDDVQPGDVHSKADD